MRKRKGQDTDEMFKKNQCKIALYEHDHMMNEKNRENEIRNLMEEKDNIDFRSEEGKKRAKNSLPGPISIQEYQKKLEEYKLLQPDTLRFHKNPDTRQAKIELSSQNWVKLVKDVNQKILKLIRPYIPS
jgi:hypothetical protein